MRIFSTLATIMLLSFPSLLLSQTYTDQKEETRATWVATVYNLDWPLASSAPPSFQKSDMVTLFTNLKKSGINTIYFQVRTYADAMYESNYEPWSRYLTGTQGQAPNPMWDPLSYAIQLAHDNGMELHAWINPYRARTNPGKISGDLSQYPELFSGVEASSYSESLKATLLKDEITAIDHVTVQHPEWILDVGTVGILNPGLDEVVDYITDVVMDIVNRYDIDGVHFDDYFYPYPPNEIGSQDQETFLANGRGIANIGDWRRDNINRMIKSVYDSIMTVKPFIRYGISPFGIWKSGTPTNASGMSAYSTIYADAPAWLNGEYVDYLAPQLYWPFVAFPVGQDFGLLAGWWGSIRNGRHLYPGHGLYRADRTSYPSGAMFSVNEVPKQIRFIRNDTNLQGSVFFRARNISTYKTQGFSDSLKNNYYKYPALPPPMSWKASVKPMSPQNLSVAPIIIDEVITNFALNWDKVIVPEGNDTTLKYAVYRVTADQQPTMEEVYSDIRNLIAVTGTPTYTDKLPGTGAPNWYVVTAVNRNSVESDASNFVETEILTSTEESDVFELPKQIVLEQNYPNPFNPSTKITFSVPNAEQLTLKVYDMLGREVAVLANGLFNSGSHSVQFDASRFSSGIYFYTLQTSQVSITKRMVLLK